MSHKIIYDEPMSDYHEAWQWLSKSSIDLLLLSPRHFFNSHLDSEGMSEKSTKYQSLGTHAHTIILENERFKNDYLCGPEGKNRSHAPFKKMVEENPGKIVLTHTEYRTLEAIAFSIHSEPLGKYLLSLEGEPEVSCYWEDPHQKQKLKCRPDKLCQSSKLVIDIKTTGIIGKFRFERHAKELGYYRSAAITLRGLKEITGEDYAYLFLVVEMSPPFNVAAYSYCSKSLEFANSEIDKAITIYKDSQKTNKWPGYPQEIQCISLPKYLIGEANG